MERHADDVTLQELVRLRVENEQLREALQKIADGERYQEDGSQYHVGYWGDFARSTLQQKESE